MDENQYDAEVLLLLAAAVTARWRRPKVREDRDNIATSCPEFENIMADMAGAGYCREDLFDVDGTAAEASHCHFFVSIFGLSTFGEESPTLDLLLPFAIISTIVRWKISLNRKS